MPPIRPHRTLVAALFAMGVTCAAGAAEPEDLRQLQYPPEDLGAQTLEKRKEAQLRTLPRFQVPTELGFEDHLPGSGIDFEHLAVPDARKEWMPVHYDHGNGVAAADVDGDGRYDLYFTSQLGGNRLYRNLGGGKFEDITEAAGVGFEDRIGVAASFADVDNDGDPDLYVTSVRTGNSLLLNDGKGRFRDVTEGSGLEYTGHSSGAVFVDYDLDGRLDLFLTNVGVYTVDEKRPEGNHKGREDAFLGHRFEERTETSILYRNLGNGKFQDVSAEVGLVDGSWSGDASFADLDRDRYPEIYVLNMQGDDHYWKNVDGERFVDRTAQTFGKTPWGAMGVAFFDLNNDGRQDLIVTDMHSDMHEMEVHPLSDEKKKYSPPMDDAENNILGNAFYLQQDDGSFEEVSDLIGAENYWPWGVSVGDLNADGFEDVFVASSMNFPFRYGVNSVLLNNRGKQLLDAEFIVGVEPRRDGRTHKTLFEVDCAGPDEENIACAVARAEAGDEPVGRVVVSGAVGTRSSVIFDLDDDGDLDIVTNEFNDVPQVLVSDLAETLDPHFLKLRLRGTTSNRDGLGARVTVTAGDLVQTRYHTGKSGYLAQSSLPLYFGLGKRAEVDRIEILWPSGIEQVVTEDIPIDALFELVEEAPAPEEEAGETTEDDEPTGGDDG